MDTKLPLTRAARQRELIGALRTLTEPAITDWAVEREARDARCKRPGVLVEHFRDDYYEVTALGNGKPIWHTYICKSEKQKVDIALRELIRAHQLLGIRFEGGPYDSIHVDRQGENPD